MSLALLSPDARQRAWTLPGVAAPGAQLLTQRSGTVTNYPVYTSAALTTAHPNPVVADANGLFPAIYLVPGIQYRFTCTTSTGAAIWGPQDGIGTGGTGGATGATYDITTYGAITGGVVDCLAAVQAAVDAAAAAGGGTVYLPRGIWRLSGKVNVRGSNDLQIRGESAHGSVLLCDDFANFALRVDVPSTDTVTTSVLAANVAIGDRTITVAAGEGANFPAGGRIYVDDSATNTGSFITYIDSVAGDVLTIQDAAPCALTTASTATVHYRPNGPLEGFVAECFTIKCVAAVPTVMSVLVMVLHAHAPVVRDVHCAGSINALIAFQECDDGVVDAVTCENGLGNSSSSVNLINSTACVVSNSSARHTQFGFTATKSPKCRWIGNSVRGRQTGSAGGRGIKLQSSSNFCVISGNTVTDNNFFAIYLQDDAFCTVTANTCFSNGSASDSEMGIQVGGIEPDFCHHNILSSNVVRGASAFGISITPTLSGATRDLHNLVIGNSVSGCTKGAIQIYACNDTQVLGNHLSAPAAGVANGLIWVSGGAKRTIITENVLSTEDTALVGILSTAGDGTTVVLRNTLGATVTQSLHANDTRDVLPKRPVVSNATVSTGANTTETTAWLVTVPGGTLSGAVNEVVQVRARFSTAANANNKTITVYAGTASAASTRASNAEVLTLELTGVVIASNHIVWMGRILTGATGVASVLMGDVFISSTDDWTADQPVKITITNGTATAADITFQQAALWYSGSPPAAFS